MQEVNEQVKEKFKEREKCEQEIASIQEQIEALNKRKENEIEILFNVYQSLSSALKRALVDLSSRLQKV